MATISMDVLAKLDERSLDMVARRLETRLERAGATSGEAISAAIEAEARRTGLGADRIGAELTRRMETHGENAGNVLAQHMVSAFTSAAPGAFGEAFGEITNAARGMSAGLVTEGAMAATGVLAIGAAAIEAGRGVFELGEKFEEVTRGIAIRTGKLGNDLNSITESVDTVAKTTAASIQQIGDIGGRVAQAFQITGEPLENLTRQIANLNRMTGENLNIREFAKDMRAFGVDAENAPKALDELYAASTRTGAPVNELVGSLKSLGPAARSLGLDIGQTSNLIDAFDKAGLDADSTVRGLNKLVAEATKHHLDFKNVLAQAVTEVHNFLQAGDPQKAEQVAIGLFGSRGAQQFVDAVRSGKLTVDSLNQSMEQTGPSIDDMNDKTMRWADTWQIVKNRIQEALKPLAEPAFNFMQDMLRDLADPHRHDHESYGFSKPGTPLGPGQVLQGLGLPGLPGAPPGAPPAAAPGVAPPAPGSPLANMLAPGNPLGNMLGGSSGVPAFPKPPGDAGHPGTGPQQTSLYDALQADSAKAPQIPYPADYGQPPAPGETEEHWQRRMAVINADHDVAQAQANVEQLRKQGNADQNDLIKAENAVVQARLGLVRAQQELAKPAQQAKAEVPFGPGYGAPPRPGETSQQYEAEQSYLEAQHRTATARARFTQVQGDPNKTPEDLVTAENAVTEARRQEIQAAMRLQDAFTKSSKTLDEFGVKLDADFGISKGLPGIADNLIRFLASLAMAPAEGALGGVMKATGYPQGAGGLVGLAGVLGGYGAAGGEPGLAGFANSAITNFGGGNTNPGMTPTAAITAAGGLNLSTIPVAAQKYANDCIDASARIILSHSGVNMSEDQLEKVIAPGGTIDSQAAGMNQLDPAGRFVPMAGSGGSAAALFAAVKASIDNGTGSILNVAPGSSIAGRNFSEGHFIAATGYNPDGTINLSDTARGTQYSVSAADAFQATRGRGIVAGTGSGPGAISGGAGGFGPGGGGGLNWDALAAKESSGNWGINSGNGYYGGLQFDQSTWAQYGGTAFAPNAALATKDQQIQIAQRAYQARGGGQTLWPQNYGQLNAPGFATGGMVPNTWVPDPSMVGSGDMSGVPAGSGMFSSGTTGGGPTRSIPGATGPVPGMGPVPVPVPGHFAAGGFPGGPKGSDTVPAWLSPGEVVEQKTAVNKYGASFMNRLNQGLVDPKIVKYFDLGGLVGFPDAPPPPTPPPAPPMPIPSAIPASPTDILNNLYGTQPQQTPGLIPSLTDKDRPSLGPGAPKPGDGPQPPKTPAPPAPPKVGTQPDPNAHIPGGLPGPKPDQAPGGPQPGPTMVGGVAPPKGSGPGFSVSGGIIGAAEGAASSAGNLFAPGAGAAAQIGFAEINRAIGAAGQAGGALMSGALQTFLPAGGSELAQNSWLTKFASGIVGAKPQLPNVAGPKGKGGGGLTPEQMAEQSGGAAPGPAAGGGGNVHNGPIVHIDHLTAPTEDSAGADISRHLQAAYNPSALFGSR